MKNLTLLIAFHITTISLLAQQPEKVIPFASESSTFIRDIAVDNNKNSYITGYYLGNLEVADSVYPSSGSSDIFIAKIDSNGGATWVQTLGGVEEDRAHAITLAPDGSVYVCGYFSDDIILAGIDTIKHSLTKDALILKLNNAGEFVWHNTITTLGDDELYDVSLSATNKLVAGGYFSENLDIATQAGTESYATSVARPLLIQINEAGSYDWVSSLGTEERSYIYGVHHSDENTILTTGHFTGSLPTSDGKKISSEGIQDIFIAQYDTTGSYQNQNTFGSSGDDAGYAIATTTDGIYLAGNFSTKLRLANTPSLSGFGYRDGVLIRLDSNLKTVKASQIGGLYNDEVYNLTSGDNNLYITGSFRGLASFNGAKPTHPRTSSGGDDIYVSKYNGSLDLQWTQTAGGSSKDIASGIAYLNGSLWVSGLNFRIDFPYATDTLKSSSFASSTIIQLKDCGFSPILLVDGDWLKPQESFDQIQWLDCNADLAEIKGETSDSFLPETSGLYAARITKGECESITECYTYKSTASSRSATATESRVWPNPTTNYIHISTDKPLLSITVVNILGKTIYQNLPANNRIDASEWVAGYYYLILETEIGKSIQKVVKM